MRESEPIGALYEIAASERLRLRRPERSIETLKALAASGATGLAKRAQAELRERVTADLRKELGR